MALFTLNHGFVGRSTDKPRTASGYAKYIMRNKACTETLGQRMPTDRKAVMDWLDREERADRKNARVIDKVMVGLQRELTHEQNAELLQEFCERVTEGRASWLAAIHDGPGDADNPHAHIIFRDRDEDGRRVMMTSEKGSTQRFRDAWEQEVNIALERAGREERVDGRSLEDQGVDREPQLHVGASYKHLAERDHEFRSQAVAIFRHVDGRRETVTVNYPAIDEGKTRWQENEERKARNFEREFDAFLKSYDPQEPAPQLEDGWWEIGRKSFGDPERIAALEKVTREEQRYIAIYNMMFATSDDAAITASEGTIANLAIEHYNETRNKGWHRGRDELEVGTEREAEESRKDAMSGLGGAGLAALGRISESFETLFGGSSEVEEERGDMAEEQQISRRQAAVQAQQKLTEEERAMYRKQELQALLEQRDRERHMDRGR